MWPALFCALPLIAAHTGLLILFDLGARPVAALAIFGAAAVTLVWGYRRLRTLPGTKGAGILLVACLLRLLLLPLPPTLSDDLLRYVWDGKVTAAGLNPYLLPPEAVELEPLRDEIWERLQHREVPTVYPPFAMAFFSIAARLPAPVYSLKSLLAMADLGGCALLLAIARRLELPSDRVVWYAWNPLVTLEIAGMGHVDGLGTTAVAATVLFLVARGARPLTAGAAAAAAALAKLIPLVLLPIWARAARRRVLFLAAAIALFAAAVLPVARATGGVPPGLVTFGVSWEFNGPLYEPLWRLLDRAGAPARIEAALDRRKQIDQRHEFWNRFYPYNYPQLLAKLLLVPGLAAGLLLAWRRGREPVAATGIGFAAVLLFSATVYPWYLVWILPWAALCLQPAWLLLSFILPLSYLSQLAGIELVPWIYLAVWVPFFGLLAVRRRWSTG